MFSVDPRECVCVLIDGRVTRLRHERIVIVDQYTGKGNKRCRRTSVAGKYYGCPLPSVTEYVCPITAKLRNNRRSDQVSVSTLKPIDATRKRSFQTVYKDIGMRLCVGTAIDDLKLV